MIVWDVLYETHENSIKKSTKKKENNVVLSLISSDHGTTFKELQIIQFLFLDRLTILKFS